MKGGAFGTVLEELQDPEWLTLWICCIDADRPTMRPLLFRSIWEQSLSGRNSSQRCRNRQPLPGFRLLCRPIEVLIVAGFNAEVAVALTVHDSPGVPESAFPARSLMVLPEITATRYVAATASNADSPLMTYTFPLIAVNLMPASVPRFVPFRLKLASVTFCTASENVMIAASAAVLVGVTVCDQTAVGGAVSIHPTHALSSRCQISGKILKGIAGGKRLTRCKFWQGCPRNLAKSGR